MIGIPLVSIVIPCYNVEKYVEACVNSVLLQNYANWECILINDGSTDQTLELITAFGSKDPRFRIFTQENSGLSATRNRGIESSNGDFLLFLDSDDILVQDAVQTLVSSFQNNDIIVGVTSAATFANGTVQRLSQLYHPKEGAVTFGNTHFEVLVRTMEAGISPVAQNKLYRKELIDNHQLRFKSGILHEDELWFFETMLFAKNVKFINYETYVYRIDNQDSITKNVGDRNLDSYLQVMEEIIEKYSAQKQYGTIAKWYAVYIKKIFLDFAIREHAKLSSEIIYRLESALKESYRPLRKDFLLSQNNALYYKTINQLSLQPFSVIKKYFFRNPVNSFRKMKNVFIISYLLK